MPFYALINSLFFESLLHLQASIHKRAGSFKA